MADKTIDCHLRTSPEPVGPVFIGTIKVGTTVDSGDTLNVGALLPGVKQVRLAILQHGTGYKADAHACDVSGTGITFRTGTGDDPNGYQELFIVADSGTSGHIV